jgi:hypothetical protein
VSDEIVRKKNLHLRTLDRKLRQLEVMLRAANKDPDYNKIVEIIDQRLNDKRSLLVAALMSVLQTLKSNPYGLNILSCSYLDIENYFETDIDGKALLQFAESCYDNLLKSLVKAIA